MKLYMAPTARFDIATVVMEDIAVPNVEQRVSLVAGPAGSFVRERARSVCLGSKLVVVINFANI